MTPSPKRNRVSFLPIALAASVLAAVLGLLSFVRQIELRTYDVRVVATARPASTQKNSAIVEINDDSLRRMEPLVGRWPWPRLVHAQLIDYLSAGGARVIAYDVLFTERDQKKFMVGDTEWTGEESDRVLVDATAKAGNVVHAAEVSSAGLTDLSRALAAPIEGVTSLNQPFQVDSCVEARPTVTPPFPALASAALAIGHTLFIYDPDGPLRRTSPLVRVGNRVVPSMALATTMVADSVKTADVHLGNGVLSIGSFAVPLVTDTIAKEPVLNSSEPTVPTRIDVEVGASYLSPPNDVKRAIHEAIANAPLAMTSPEPQVVIKGFGGSAIDYLAQFWIEDYAVDRSARDQVRTNIWYEFRRRNIEIPWPIQVQYERDEEPVRTDRHIDDAGAQLGAIDLFTTLSPEARRALSAAAKDHLFAKGEAIVRQGAVGDSMFVILSGQVSVTIEPSGLEVGVIAAGGFFGEMSMLTGDPRTATVRAAADAEVLEIESSALRDLALANPGLIDHVTAVMTTRRVGLDEAKATAAAVPATEQRETLLSRIQRFLRV